MSNSAIRPIERNLSGAAIPSQRETESDDYKGVFPIPQSSSITGVSAADCLMSYPGHSLVEGSFSLILSLCD